MGVEMLRDIHRLLHGKRKAGCQARGMNDFFKKIGEIGRGVVKRKDVFWGAATSRSLGKIF